MSKVVCPPPPHSRLGGFTPAPTGRPPVWCWLLAAWKQGKRVRHGPYRNETTAVAAASAFNAQIRTHNYEDYEEGLRFRSRGLFVILRDITPQEED